MKRDKNWWSKYTEEERSWIVYYERAQNRFSGYGGMLPDDITECQCCSNPAQSNICNNCLDIYDQLMQKQNMKDA